MVSKPESAAMRRSLEIFVRAVSVQYKGQNLIGTVQTAGLSSQGAGGRIS